MDIDSHEKHIRRLLEFEVWARPLLEEILALKNAALADVEAVIEPEPETPSDPEAQTESEAQPEQPAAEEPATAEPEKEEPVEPAAEQAPAEEAVQPETPPAA